MHVTPRGSRQGAEAAAQTPPHVPTTSTPVYRVSTGADLLAEVELSICGIEVVATDAQAEGLALAGQRAARELSPVPPTAEPRAGWVLHKSGVPAQFGAFTLAASDAQEAADHVLIAQVLCALTDSGVECVVGPNFAGRPWQYRPHSQKVIHAALSLRLPAGADKADAAPLAFEQVSGLTGRPRGALVEYRLDDAEVALIAYGEERERANDIADVLRGQGVSVGVIGVALLHPFPEEAFAQLVVGKRAIVVVGSDDAFSEDVVRSAKRAGDGTPIELHQARCVLSDVQRAISVEASAEKTAEEPCVTIGVVPGGPRAKELLFAAVARVGEPLATFSIPSAPGVAALGVARRAVSEPRATLDLAFIAHTSLLDDSLGLSQGARVILAQEADSAGHVVASLSATQRRLCKELDLVVDWFNPATGEDGDLAPGADWTRLQEALLDAAIPILSERVGVSERTSEAARLVRIDASHLPTQRPREVNFRPQRQRPLLPKAGGETNDAWRMALRRFHLTGKGAAGASALLPLAPAAATRLVRDFPSVYPLVVCAGEQPEIISFEQLLERTFEELAKSGTPLAIVVEHRRRLVADALAVVAERGTADVAVVLEAACKSFSAELSLSDKAKSTLTEEVHALQQAINVEGRVLGLSRHAHLEMYAALVLPERRRRRATLQAEVRWLHDRLADILAVDHSHSAEAVTPENVAKTLGSVDFLDPTALARAVRSRPGPKRISDERRSRVQTALAILGDYLARMDSLPELFLVSSERVELGPWRVHHVEHGSPLGVAAGLFDGLVREITPVLLALRVARLESEALYDKAVHGPVLADFDWTRFEEQELLFLPPVLAVESAENVWHSSQRVLSDVLQSGRPIHVIVEEELGLAAELQPPGLGYTLVAQREAVVVQTTLARPEHLTRGLATMAAASRPAVAVLTPRPPQGPMPAWVRLIAAHEGRALPCFCYAPDQGLTWAESFDIAGNPAPEASWSTHEIEAEDEEGEAQTVVDRFTFAHAAALELAYRHHFWVIPPEAWSDEQVPLADYLDQLLDDDAASVPFIWVTDEQGNLGRAVLSRQLAVESHRRMRLWRVLEELGGARNEHARRAASAAQDTARAEAAAEQGELETRHAAELDRVRNEVASEALGRLAQALMNPDALDLASAVAVPRPLSVVSEVPASLAADEAAPDTDPTPTVVEEEEEESVSFSDPFIDTVLCTTCNECTNINPKMFVYNADKQAELADAKAGTFLQLVKSAEKCPAKCIHPGEPRKDDTTVTDDLIARAAKFN